MQFRALQRLPSGTVVRNLPANGGDARDMGSIPGSGRSPGEGNGNTLQYSCLENPMDQGAWWAAVYRVTQSQTRLKQLIAKLRLKLKNVGEITRLFRFDLNQIPYIYTLEWVAMPSSRGSSQPRDQTQVSGIARGFFTI